MAEPILNTNFNFPHINIYDITNDENELLYYEARPEANYVMYDRNANYTEIDPETEEEIPVTYYYTIAAIPKTFNFALFPFVAVPRADVDENYIFSIGGKPEHEVM